MPECSGGWYGDGAGTWVGSFDDSNMIALQRETNGYCITTNRSVSQIETQCQGQYGFQANWDLLHGVQLSWQGWLGVSQSHDYTWYETARQVDGTNEIVTSNAVDLAECLVKLRALEAKTEQIYVAVGNVANLVNSCLTAIVGVRDILTAFRDEVYKRLLRAVGAVSEVVHASLLPIYRLCRANPSPSAKFGSVTVGADLQTHSTIAPNVTDAVASSFGDDSGLYVEAWELADYGLFHPVSGSADLYYSSELRQVISRPYRNSGQVYLG